MSPKDPLSESDEQLARRTAPSIEEFLVQHGAGSAPTSPPEHDPAGEMLYVAGSRKYRMQSEIARGGMGIVYGAEDVNCRRAVAIKVIAPDKPIPSEDLLRFVEEAQITSQLEHPNIVP